MIAEPIPDGDLRSAITDALSAEPGATLTQVQNKLRVRIGRPLEPEEVQRLHDIYSEEGFAASAGSIVANREAKALSLASLSHARPHAKELIGLVAAILPFFVHFQSAGPTRPNAPPPTSFFDLVALVGGLVALFCGIGAVLVLEKGPQRPFHLGIGVVLLVLGAYQLMLGLGLLHKLGLIPYA